MRFFLDMWQNDVLKCACFSWVAAQALKVLITLWIEKKMDWRRWFGMGGMPSSHTAFVFSLMLMTGICCAAVLLFLYLVNENVNPSQVRNVQEDNRGEL